MRTAIYVDGFNLYHSALEHRPEWKWLDLKRLAQVVLDSDFDVVRVVYCTSRVSATPDSPNAPTKQDLYLKALGAHIPELVVQYGQFENQDLWARLKDPPSGLSPAPERAHVMRRQEKGSDVGLAVTMVDDAWADRFDAAVVLSNDSDLCPALEAVARRGKRVDLMTTVRVACRPGKEVAVSGRAPSKKLSRLVSHTWYLTPYHMRAAQLPDVVRQEDRSFRRPADWQ